MAGQQQIKPSKSDRTQDAVEAPTVDPAVVERTEKLEGELDDLLDEVDTVLETNAEEFVKGYIQKGGQ